MKAQLLIKKTISIIVTAAFLFTSLKVEDVFARDIMAEDIATQSIFSPLADQEIKDIAMLKYALTSGMRSASVDILNELNDVTSESFGIDLGRENIQMTFHFSKAEYYQKAQLRLIPCTLKIAELEKRYWCCALGGFGKDSSFKMTFFTEKEKDENDIVGKVHTLKVKQREENMAIQKAAKSELDQDEVIREAIREDRYKTIPSSYAELYVIYAFLDIVSPQASKDFRALVDNGQVMIIGAISSGERLGEPHAGSQGIYFPDEERYINAETFIHEIFAKSGFTHEECLAFEGIFSKYKKAFKDDTPDISQSIPQEMLKELSPDEKALLARASGSLGFIDPVNFISTRDYSSQDDDPEDPAGSFPGEFYGSLGRSEDIPEKPVDFDTYVYTRPGKTVSEEEIAEFFEKGKNADAFRSVQKDDIVKVISLFSSMGKEEEANKLRELLKRKTIRIVTPLDGKALFGKKIFGAYKQWPMSLAGKIANVSSTSSFQLVPWFFITSEASGYERDNFISTIAYLTSVAIGKTEQESRSFAESMASSKAVYSRGGRIPTVREVESDVELLVSSEEKMSPLPLSAAMKAAEIMDRLGMEEEASKLKQMTNENKISVVKAKGVFSSIYGVNAPHGGKEHIFISEDIATWDSKQFLPTLHYCLKNIMGERVGEQAGFEVMPSSHIRSIERILSILNKNKEADLLQELHDKQRIRIVERTPAFDEGENAKMIKDDSDESWIFIDTDAVGSSNGLELPAIAGALAGLLEYGPSERSQFVQTLTEDSRVALPMPRKELKVLSQLIKDLEELKKETVKWTKTADVVHRLKSSIWKNFAYSLMIDGAVVDIHTPGRVINLMGTARGLNASSDPRTFDEATAITVTDMDTGEQIRFDAFDICRHVMKQLLSGGDITNDEFIVSFVTEGLKEDIAREKKDPRDREKAVDAVWKKIMAGYYRKIKGMSYIDPSGEIKSVGSSIDKKLVDMVLKGEAEVLSMEFDDEVFNRKPVMTREELLVEVSRTLREYPDETSIEKISDAAINGLKLEIQNPWFKVAEPSIAMSRKIRDELIPENNNNIMGIVLHTITHGSFEYYNSTLTQDASIDLHSLSSVDFMNGVSAILTGYAQLVPQMPKFREKLLGSFEPEGIASQRFNNIISLLKSIEEIQQVVIIPNTGRNWSSPIVDIVGTMSEAAHAIDKKYHDLYDTVTVGIHVISPNGKVRDVNQYELDLFGYTKDEMIGRPIWEFAHPDQRLEVRERVIYRGLGKPADEIPERKFKYRVYKNKNGGDIIVSTRDTVVYNDAGRVVEVRTVLRDITKHVEAEQRISGMLENMPSAVFFKEYDPITDEFRFKYANSKFYEFLGLDPAVDSIVGLTEFDVRNRYKSGEKDTPYHAEWYDKDDRAVFAGKKTYYKEEEMMGWNGHQAMVHRQKVRMGNGVLGVFTDITAVKKAQEEVQKSEALYRHLFENMMDGFAYHEMIYNDAGEAVDYRFKQVNPEFAKILGMPADEIIGKTVKELLPGTEQFWIDLFSEVVETGEPKRVENYSKELDKWFVVTAYRPEEGCFAAIAEDVTDRKKDALVVRESEEKYRRVVEMASDSIWEADLNGNFTFTSKKTAEMLGYNLDELSGKGLADTLTPQSYQKYIQLVSQEWEAPASTESISPIILEADHVKKDGTIIKCEISAILVRSEEGKAVSVSGITRDITERVKMHEERAYMTSIIETTTDIATVKDLNGRIIAVNQAFLDHLPTGTAKDDVLGKTDEEVFEGLIDKDTLRVYLEDEESSRTGRTVERIEPIPGNRIVHTRKFPIYRNGEIIATANISRDITDSQKIKKSLQEATERFETIFTSNPLPIIIFDAITQKCVSANNAAQELYGYTFDEFKQMSPEDLREGEFILRDEELDRHAHTPLRKDRGEAIHFESKQMKRDGSLFDADLTMFNFTVDSEMLTGFIVEDVTEAKRTQARLSEETRLTKLSNEVTHLLMTSGDMNEIAGLIRNELDLFGASIGLIKPGTSDLEVLGSVTGFPRIVQSAIRRIKFDLDKNEKAREFFERINGPTFIGSKDLVELIDEENSITGIIADGLIKVILEKRFGEMMLFPLKDKNGKRIGAILLSKKEGEEFNSSEKASIGHLALDIGLLLDRDRIAQALISAEEEYRTVIEDVQRPIIRVSPEGKIQFMNSYAIDHLDLEGSSQDYKGKTLWDIFPEEVADQWMSHIKEVIKFKKETISSEMGMEDGEQKWFRSIHNPQLDPVTGEVVSIVIVMSDVTAYKQAADALKESEDKYRTLVSLDPDAIAVTQNKKFVFANQALAELLGVSLTDLMGKGISDFATDKSLAKMWQEHEARLSGKKKVSIYEADLINTEGKVIPVEIHAGVIAREGEQACLLSIRDISDRKKAEEVKAKYQRKLEDAARQWESTFNSTSEMFALLGPHKRILRVNKAFCDIVGKEADDLIGKSCCEVIHGEGCSFNGTCSLVEAEKLKNSVEAFFYEKNLNIWLEVLVSPILDDSGEIIGYVHVSRDVTERKRMEQELDEYRYDLEKKVEDRTREVDRINRELSLKKRLAELGQMAAGIAHEIRNPVTSAAGMIRMFKETGDASLLEEALGELDRGGRLVEDLLGYSREEAPAMSPANYADLLKEAILKCKNVITEYDVNVEIDVDESVVVMANKDRLLQVYINLITNACHAMEERFQRNIRIELQSDEEAGQAIVKVMDTGSGMKQETIDNLFTPFFTTKKAGKGTGLGMALVQKIISAHSGRIDVDSQINIGTSFTVKMPTVGKKAGPEQSEVERTEESLSKEPIRKISRVLFVDDMSSMRKIWETILYKQGIEIVTSSNIEEAIEAFDKNSVDVVITDVNMDKTSVDGYVLAVELRAKGFTGPIVVSTAGDPNDMKISSLRKDGVIDMVLTKDSKLLSAENIANAIFRLERVPEPEWNSKSVDRYHRLIAEGKVSESLFGSIEVESLEGTDGKDGEYRIIPDHPKGFNHEVISYINGLGLMNYFPDEVQHPDMAHLSAEMMRILRSISDVKKVSFDLLEAIQLLSMVSKEYREIANMFKVMSEWNSPSEVERNKDRYSAEDYSELVEDAKMFDTSARSGAEFLENYLSDAEQKLAVWMSQLEEGESPKEEINIQPGDLREVIDVEERHDIRNIIAVVMGNITFLQSMGEDGEIELPEEFEKILRSLNVINAQFELLPEGHIENPSSAASAAEKFSKVLKDLSASFDSVYEMVDALHSKYKREGSVEPAILEIFDAISLSCGSESDAQRKLATFAGIADLRSERWREQAKAQTEHEELDTRSFDSLLSSAERDFLEEVDSSFVGMIFLNMEGELIFANRSSMDILGRKDVRRLSGINILGRAGLSDETLAKLKSGTASFLSKEELSGLKEKGILNREINELDELDFCITPLAMVEGSSAGFILQLHDARREEEVLAEENLHKEIAIGDMIRSGRVSALPSKVKALQLQMISADKVALVYGSMEKGLSRLRRAGFKGEIRLARNEIELSALHLDGKLADVDVIVNTTSYDIKRILQNIDLEIAIIDDITDTHNLQNVLLEICA